MSMAKSSEGTGRRRPEVARGVMIAVVGIATLVAAVAVGTAAVAPGVRAASSCNVTWTGKAGDSRWNTAGNWSTGKVPGPTSDVCMSPFAFVTATGSQSVHSLRVLSEMTLTFEPGSHLTVATALINQATFQLDGAALTAGSIKNEASAASSAAIDTSGTSTINSASFSNAGNLSVVDGTLTLAKAPLNLKSGMLAGGSWLAENGVVALPGDITALSGGSSVTISGQSAAIRDASGANALAGLSSVGANSSLTVTDTNALALKGGLTSSGSVEVGVGYNSGGGSLSIAGAYVQNAGAFGELAGATSASFSAASISIQSGSRFAAETGALHGNVSNAGTLQVGTATLAGSYTQTSAATLDVGVGSTLAVSGSAALAGVLQVSPFIVPAPGTSFTALSASAISGAFASHTLGFVVTQQPAQIVVTAQPQIAVSPASVMAGGSATVDGGDFAYSTNVIIFLDSTSGTPLASVTPPLDGFFSVQVVIPSGTSAGTHQLIALAADGRTAQVAIQVS